MKTGAVNDRKGRFCWEAKGGVFAHWGRPEVVGGHHNSDLTASAALQA